MTTEERIALLKMTYGNVKQISENIAITNNSGASTQKLLLISTGEILEERQVEKFYERGIYKHTCWISKEKHGLLYSFPQPKISNRKFRIYNELGEVIYTLNTKMDAYVSIEDFDLIDDRVFLKIIRKYAGRFQGLVYNKETKQLDIIYNMVAFKYFDTTNTIEFISINSKDNRENIELKVKPQQENRNNGEQGQTSIIKI